MKISTVIITNSQRPNVLLVSVESARRCSDEVIVVGHIAIDLPIDVQVIHDEKSAIQGNLGKMRNAGAHQATGDTVVNADDDIFFPHNFRKKLCKYHSQHNNFGSLTTKVIGINGSRYWDRAVHTNGLSHMIDYHQTHPDLYYSGAFVIRQKWFAEKYQWDEHLKFYQAEDVRYSSVIKQHQHEINIDVNNYVVHNDPSYISYINGDKQLVCGRNVGSLYENVRQEKEYRELQQYLIPQQIQTTQQTVIAK